MTGGGIKGLIEAYKAHGVIDAGDFVKFSSDYSQTNEVKDTQLTSTADVGKVISAVALSKNKVFVVYSDKNDGSNSKSYLYGVVCIISGAMLTTGTAKKIQTAGYVGNVTSVISLNENKVFVAYSYGSSKYLYGIVCVIDETMITAGKDTALSSPSFSGGCISTVALDEGKVFIAHSYSSSYYLYGMVCTISGITISKGTDTVLSNGNYDALAISAVALSESDVIISHTYIQSTNTYDIKFTRCTINGTTVISNNNKALKALYTETAGIKISAVKLSKNKALIVHNYDNIDYRIYGVIVTLSGTEAITVGTDTALNSVSNTGKVISAVAFSENKILITHSDSNDYLYSMLCDIDGDTITAETDISLSSTENSGASISAIALTENRAFIAHSNTSSNYLNAMLQEYFLTLAQAVKTKNEVINGVAISSANDGEMVQVKVPGEE